MKATLPTIKELKQAIAYAKSVIDCGQFEKGETPYTELTIGWNAETGNWSGQTGDNSFTGNAYGFPHWAVVTVCKRSNAIELAREIRNQLEELSSC